MKEVSRITDLGKTKKNCPLFLLSVCYSLMKGAPRASWAEMGPGEIPPQVIPIEQDPPGLGCDQSWKGPGL